MTALLSRRAPILEEGAIAGNLYDKYGSRNPVARHLMGGFLACVERLVRQSGASEIHEVGCGEGSLAILLTRDGRRVRASDRSQQVIAEAERAAEQRGVEVAFKVARLESLTPEEDAAELIVCCETLEHLENPREALRILSGLARPHLLLSVPREPLWRFLNLARLSYVRDLGNTPGHLQHWSKSSFLALLRAYVDVIEVESPLPWTVALCRAR